jgi:hypothetical protein
MSIGTKPLPRVTSVSIEGGRISAHLADGRIISIPLGWSPRLAAATAEQRTRYRIIGDGEGVHWPDVDEDISVEGMLFPPASSGS